MLIEENVDLSLYTTFRMGGVARRLIIPQTDNELLDVIQNTKLPRYIIGGGSNLLINNQREFEEVISLREFNKNIISVGDGKFFVGAAVRLQKLIQTVNEDGYGGIEYLYSVPGLVGGAVVMNAGRGNSKDEIGKYVVSVRAIKDGEIVEFDKEDCQFRKRGSIFKNSDIIILGALFQFIPGKPEDFKKLREERIEYVKKVQDTSKPNFGTVFFKADSYIMGFVQKCSKSGSGVYFSPKTRNWMLNNGGTFEQAMVEINRVKKIHKFFHRPCEIEVIVWE